MSMKKQTIFLVATIVVLLVIVIAGAEIRIKIGDSESNESVITEVRAAVANYYYGFSNFSPTQIADELYGAPLSRVSLDGTTTVWNTEEEVMEMVRGFISNLEEQQWYRSDMPIYEICVLGPKTAFVSGTFIRYREDDSEIGQTGLTYLYQNKSEGWRVTSMIYQSNDIDIRC
jgi:hypothetical protein